MSSILVTGASGQLGRLVTRKLRERGVAFLAGTRDPSKLDLPEVRRVDFDDPASLDTAFQGVDRLLLISTDSLDEPGKRGRQHKVAIDAAVCAGVKHIVYTSLAKAEAGNPILLTGDHIATEEALKASGVGYTSLRNAMYAEMLLGSLPKSIASGTPWFSATGTGAAGFVTREDCAEAAVAALLDGFEGTRVLEITGPEAVTYDEIAAAAAEVTGKPVQHQAIPAEALVNAIVDHAGLPRPIAELLVSFDTAISQGWMPASTDFATLTGKKGTGIRAFFEANRAALG